MNVQEANVEPAFATYGVAGAQRPTLNVKCRPSLLLLLLLILAIDKT
jgi:hypothetical protein